MDRTPFPIPDCPDALRLFPIPCSRGHAHSRRGKDVKIDGRDDDCVKKMTRSKSLIIDNLHEANPDRRINRA